jgi:hypothetical protein
MKRFKIIGLCLVAAFALSAVGASAASAVTPPEFLGTFPDHFTSHGGISTLKTTTVPKTVTCSNVDNIGEITGAKTALVLVTFLGCKLSGTFPCSSGEGAGIEEIMTSLLNVTLGYIKASTHEVGTRLTGTGGSEGNLLALFTCENQLAKVKGSVIGQIPSADLNVLTLAFTINFAESSEKVQAVLKLEGESKKSFLETSLNKGAFENSAEASGDELLLEKDVKIDA